MELRVLEATGVDTKLGGAALGTLSVNGPLECIMSTKVDKAWEQQRVGSSNLPYN